MIDLSDQYLMMIEPPAPASAPINDNLTALAERVLKSAKVGSAWKGRHRCACNVMSDNYDWILPDGKITNSLLVHYVQCHRQDVPRSEIAKLLCYERSVTS